MEIDHLSLIPSAPSPSAEPSANQMSRTINRKGTHVTQAVSGAEETPTVNAVVVRLGRCRSGRTDYTLRSSSARPGSEISGPRCFQNESCIGDSNGVWGFGCSVVRGPTTSQSPYYNHHRCCDGESLRCAGGTRTRIRNRGRNDRRSRTLLMAENNRDERALKLVVSWVLHAFAVDSRDQVTCFLPTDNMFIFNKLLTLSSL